MSSPPVRLHLCSSPSPRLRRRSCPARRARSWHWVEDPVRLGATLVADEDHPSAPVVKLLWVRMHAFNVRHAAESPEIMHIRLGVVPGLERRFFGDAPSERPI